MLPAIVFLQFLLTCYGDEFFVYPTLLQRRAGTSSLLLHINDKIILNLERSSVLADELHFLTASDQENELDLVNTSSIQESLYHDTHHQSSLRIREQDGFVKVEGVINSKLRIKPLPESERSSRGPMLHKVYEVHESEEGSLWEGRVLERLQNDDRKDRRRRKSQEPEGRDMIPELFIVELHAMSDKVHQVNFKKNEDLIAYMAVMSNAVNLRYLEMKNPRIKFKLIGVTRMVNDSFSKVGKGTIEADPTLNGLGKFHNEGKVPGNPDLVYFVTGLDMINLKAGRISKAIQGLAYRGNVCRQYRVGMGEDIPTSFSGVKTMAHELAHILGSPHDTTPKCPWSEGYLMGGYEGGTKEYRLSKCSEESIRIRVNHLPQSCIKEQSKTNYLAVYKRYPGHSVRPQHYCRRMLKVKGKGTKVSAKKPPFLSRQCKMNCCMHSSFADVCHKVDILEGMECTKGKTCRRGVCGDFNW
ncbi:venom metalloproteinase antarease-like TtrivMP_A isoform X3 [Dermacentor silvarum]|uniref:venom metalloproteinase antarease-like TtrivMP_A isoform X3 n=1 Tax=Dermacentor silvarum TaxID=543639 RepID=UPI002100909F|nr:venom metalloproteinase antarease-like TtrivMP_A isoform X3 [Dermacentor silvarum]